MFKKLVQEICTRVESLRNGSAPKPVVATRPAPPKVTDKALWELSLPEG